MPARPASQLFLDSVYYAYKVFGKIPSRLFSIFQAKFKQVVLEFCFIIKRIKTEYFSFIILNCKYSCILVSRILVISGHFCFRFEGFVGIRML